MSSRFRHMLVLTAVLALALGGIRRDGVAVS